MDYPDDHHPHHPPPSQEYVYPDIDETVHYPWQGSQPTTQGEASIHSVLDPRLYKDLFTGNASQVQDEASFEEDAEAYQEADDSDESLYTLSSEESRLVSRLHASTLILLSVADRTQ